MNTLKIAAAGLAVSIPYAGGWYLADIALDRSHGCLLAVAISFAVGFVLCHLIFSQRFTR